MVRLRCEQHCLAKRRQSLRKEHCPTDNRQGLQKRTPIAPGIRSSRNPIMPPPMAAAKASNLCQPENRPTANSVIPIRRPSAMTPPIIRKIVSKECSCSDSEAVTLSYDGPRARRAANAGIQRLRRVVVQVDRQKTNRSQCGLLRRCWQCLQHSHNLVVRRIVE